MKTRRVSVRLNEQEDMKLKQFKEKNNYNDSQAIRKLINVAEDAEDIIILHKELGLKIVNIIAASNGITDDTVKTVITSELEDIVCLLAK